MRLQVHIDFQIIDETEDWIVVNKPAPLIVHPANRKPEPTLLGGLQQVLAYEIANGQTLGIITRLDRETSGLVLVAKHTEAARELGMMSEQRLLEKEYLAVVRGWPEDDSWVANSRICRAGELGPSDIWVRQVVSDLGRASETRFQVENRFLREGVKYSLVRCFPKTGRMHQIRVHLAHAGFPIVGDKLYAYDGAEYLRWMAEGWTDELAERLLLSRQALHAARLAITWRGEKVVWSSELPEDLSAFVNGRSIFPDDNIVMLEDQG